MLPRFRRKAAMTVRRSTSSRASRREVSDGSPDGKGRSRSDGVMTRPRAMMIARLTLFSSSRTLPGHAYDRIAPSTCWLNRLGAGGPFPQTSARGKIWPTVSCPHLAPAGVESRVWQLKASRPLDLGTVFAYRSPSAHRSRPIGTLPDSASFFA